MSCVKQLLLDQETLPGALLCFIQEDDPLDAFMAELRNDERQTAPAAVPDKKRQKVDVGLDEEADNVADFMEVHTTSPDKRFRKAVSSRS